jgi:hypothetical protein
MFWIFKFLTTKLRKCTKFLKNLRRHFHFLPKVPAFSWIRRELTRQCYSSKVFNYFTQVTIILLDIIIIIDIYLLSIEEFNLCPSSESALGNEKR